MVLFCLLSPTGGAAATPWALDDQTLQSIREMKESEISLSGVILSLSQKAEQDLLGKSFDSKFADRLLRQMERGVRKRAGKNPRPEDIMAAINETLFEQYHFQADRSRLFEPSLATTLLGPVLQNRKGNCLTLSLIYLFVAKRLDLSLAGVMVPGHFFLRYSDGKGQRNIESTRRGQEISEEQYPRDDAQQPNPPGVRALTAKETIAVYLNNLATHYKIQGHYQRAIALLKTAIQLLPDQAPFFVNLGNAYERSGEIIKAGAEYDKALALDPYLCEAYYNLGLIHFLYTRQPDLARRYGNVARKLGCRLHPNYQAFLNEE